MNIEVINDEYGKETMSVSLCMSFFTVPKGNCITFKLDLTKDEVVIFPAGRRNVIYSYSDRKEYGEVYVYSYTLEEISSEKLRGLLFQRIQPSAKDLFDICWLIESGKVNWRKVFRVLPEKCEVKGIKFEKLRNGLDFQKAGISETWESTIRFLYPEAPNFESCWIKFMGIIEDFYSTFESQ